MIKRHLNTVEEEFKKYGEEQKRRKASRRSKSKSSLSRFIQFLVLLILFIVLLLLARVGYMFFTNPSEIKGIMKGVVGSASTTSSQQLASTSSLASSSSSPTQEEGRKVALINQHSVSSSISSNSPPAVQTATGLKSSDSNVNQQQTTTSQEATTTETSSSKTTSQEVTTASLAAASSVEVGASTKKNLEEMNDEELVKYLLSLEPDALERMDIKKLLLKKKGDTPTTKEGKKIAKTEYLNNQVILENSKKKEQTSNDQLANVSTRLASLVQKVEKAPSNNATSSSQQSGKSVYEQRLAPEIKVRQKTMRFYVVKPGDTLSKIAKRFYGKPSAYIIIYEANQGIISNPRLIYPGQRLRIPKL